MSAKHFAQEFINDLPELLENFDLNKNKLCFNQNTYENDPELTILKSELNQIGFDLKIINKSDTLTKQTWQLIKL